MSWYTAIKTAVVMSEEDIINQNKHYTDIGHRSYDGEQTNWKEELWAVMNDESGNYQLVIKPSGQNISHYDLNIGKSTANQIAQGRFESSPENPTGTLSLQMGSKIMNLQWTDPRRYDYVKEKVIRMLEQHYGADAVIYPF